jgi:hypothetical protein
MDNTDPLQKAQGITRKQNAVAMDAMVQSMNDTDNFHCNFLSMNKDAHWPGRKAWKIWKIIQKHNQPKDSTSARDVTSALHKIKLKKHTNPMKILTDISAVELNIRRLSMNRERLLLCRAAKEMTIPKSLL